jgi:sulfite exporter TauE/SafE
MNALWLSALVLGAAGSAHCIGMCGPIALAVPTRGPGWLARSRSTLILNSGRLLMYALIGALFGSLGAGLRLTGLQQGLSIMAGIALLLSALVPGLLERWIPSSRAALFIGRLRSVLARNLGRTGSAAVFFTGVLNGLLPCGLVYAAAIGAAAMGTAQHGALFMALFGLGTWPALIALRMSGSMIGGAVRIWLRRVSPVLVAVVGLLLILRGLDLGIPMLSPSMVAAPAGVHGCY